MKTTKIPAQSSSMTADSQNRLLAYSTAASLGAFFAGQSTEAAVVQAPGLAPYPLVILPQPAGSTNGTYHYLSIEGGSITNFVLNIGPDLLSHPTNKFGSQVIDLVGYVPDTNFPAVVNGQALTPPISPGVQNAYCVAFLGGAIIGSNTNNATAPWYANRMGLSYNYGAYPWVNYAWSNVPGFPSEFVGFEFTSSVDGQNHFGYIDVQINFVSASINYTDPSGNPATTTKQIVKSVVINDCRYETTPNADIVVPELLKITSFTEDPSQNNLITINFAPNWGGNADTFVLETSPTLDSSAVWTTDPQALVYQLTAGTSTRSSTWQALTYPTQGATTQYWRIRRL